MNHPGDLKGSPSPQPYLGASEQSGRPLSRKDGGGRLDSHGGVAPFAVRKADGR
jgi:hypothetical protein